MSGVIPAAEQGERASETGEPDRILGVVDAIKYFDSGEGGFGFLRRHKSAKANAREFHVHFRSSECEDFGKLEPGAEVAFTLKDHRGRANAKDLKAMGRIIKVPPREEKPLEPRRQPAKKVTPDTSDAAPVSETSPSDGSENSERRAQLDRLATFGIGPSAPAPPPAAPAQAAPPPPPPAAPPPQRRPPKPARESAYEKTEHLFAQDAVGQARAWAGGQRVHAHMPGCLCPDRPRNMPLDSVALRKERGSWVGTFVLQCDPMKYADDPLAAERELSARLDAGVRVECWGREALSTPLTADTDARRANEHFEDVAAPSLLLLGSKKEMEQLCDVGRELAPVARAAPCAVPWSVLARATDASDDEFGRELARLELSAYLEAQGLAVVRNDAPPLVEQSCPDLAACAPLLPTLRGDANQPLADLRVLLAAHLVDGRLVVGLPRAQRARLGEPPAHAAARGAHEILALRLGVLDDAGTSLKTVQAHAKTVVADARSRPDVCFLRCLAVDDGTAPTQLTVQNGEFVPQLFVAPQLPVTNAYAYQYAPAPGRGYGRGNPGRGRGRGQGRGFYEHPNQHEESPEPPRRKKLFPVQTRSASINERHRQNFPEPPQRKHQVREKKRFPRSFNEKKADPKSVVCCYFLMDKCRNGGACRFSHDRALPSCSWGADCRYGHGASQKTECKPCADGA